MKLKITRTEEIVTPAQEIVFGEYSENGDWMPVSIRDRKNFAQDTITKKEIQLIIDWLTEQIK